MSFPPKHHNVLIQLLFPHPNCYMCDVISMHSYSFLDSSKSIDVVCF